VAVALGATRDAAEFARGRGVRAARLHAIKKDIVANLDRDFSPDVIAGRHGISARYVRMLFEEQGTTFTEFVREERLVQAHRMLTNARLAHMRIADIAYEAGFNDLSYFNRMFRRRFALAPGEVRAQLSWSADR
jgi:AraC-like DNA-binding protein